VGLFLQCAFGLFSEWLFQIVLPVVDRRLIGHKFWGQVKVKVTLWLTWGSWPDIYYCLTITVLFLWGGLSDERMGLSCICCWPSPAQSFLSPSLLGLATIFYCLSFETSLFIASYDSQDHGGGIQPHLHTGLIFEGILGPCYIYIYSLGTGRMENTTSNSSLLCDV
jgi:hypothetical protein